MIKFAVPNKIHTHPMEGHWKFLGEGGLKSQNFRNKVLAKLEFPGGRGRGCKAKKLPWGELYGYLLELHNENIIELYGI